jgi:hypothetical protein
MSDTPFVGGRGRERDTGEVKGADRGLEPSRQNIY